MDRGESGWESDDEVLRVTAGTRGRPRWRAALWGLASVGALFLLAAGPPARTALHLGLAHAVPAAGDTVDAAPSELRLTFTANVDARLARVTLAGPEGAVPLTDPATGASDRVVVVRIADELRPGRYTVRWRVVGADGHPVTGDYAWVIRQGTAGTADAVIAEPGPTPDRADRVDPGPAAPGRPPLPEEHHIAEDPEGFGFDAESPTYVAVRWVTFAALLSLLGSVAYALVVLPLAVRRSTGEPHVAGDRAGAAAVGLVAAAALGVAALARLLAQSYAVHGATAALYPDRLALLLTGTLWGWGWLIQGVGSLAAVAALVVARRGSRTGWWVAGAVTVALAFTPALSGHAAAVEGAGGLAILADGLHVLAAGGWLGTLLVLLVVGVRRVLRGQNGKGADAVSLPPLVEAFSAAALAFASILVVTGVVSAWLHLPSVPALWRSDYGRILLLKLGVLVPVFATGAYNWLRVRPAIEKGAGAAPLRRSGWTELAVAVLVLLVTAVLVATPTPMVPGPDAATAIDSRSLNDGELP